MVDNDDPGPAPIQYDVEPAAFGALDSQFGVDAQQIIDNLAVSSRDIPDVSEEVSS